MSGKFYEKNTHLSIICTFYLAYFLFYIIYLCIFPSLFMQSDLHFLLFLCLLIYFSLPFYCSSPDN